MEIVSFEQFGDQVVGQAVAVLSDGGVVVHPTDTCYGLAANIRSKVGVEKVYQIKKMPMTKPVSILVSSLEMAQQYGVFNEVAKELAQKYWPGPLTMIVPRKPELPSYLNSEIETIGIRWPGHELSVGIIQKLGVPVVTTSANISGLKEVYRVEDFLIQLDGCCQPDLILDGGDQVKNKPSTIVAVGDQSWELVRAGELNLIEDTE